MAALARLRFEVPELNLEGSHKDGKQISHVETVVQVNSKNNKSTTEEYWKTQLAGAKRASYPAKLATISEDTVHLSHFRQTLNLKSSSKTPVTRATVLRAAWTIVLARYCDTDDLCFGALVSATATVPIRVRIDRQKTVGHFLQDIQADNAAMIAHEQFGLHEIAKLGQDAEEACDFSSLLVVTSNEQDRFRKGVLESLLNPNSSKQGLALDTSQYSYYPLIIQASIVDEKCDLHLAYNKSSLTELQMTALAHHLDNVIQQLEKDDLTVDDVSVGGTWDVEQVAKWHPPPEIVRTCTHDLITEQAIRDPGHEALWWTGGSMTYGELDHFSTNFALNLSRLGVRPGSMVPICFEKNPWAIVAMIGIMKAGGAYVPLDPSHPPLRRKSFVDEVEAEVVVVSTEAAPSCEKMATHVVEFSASLMAQLSHPVQEQLHEKPTPNHAAYILYTSGSTGRPKGVVIEQEALSSAMKGLQKGFGMGTATRTLQFSNFVFDVSVGDIFATLVGGGTVCVPTAAERMEDTPGFMVAARVNTAMLTPSFLRTFKPEQVPCLTTLITGGEPHGKDTLETWVGRVKYINAYGPTETIVYSTGHEYKLPTHPPHNIGLDKHGKSWIVEQHNHNQVTPIGCIGEIVYQGLGVARNYWKNEEKTKEGFIYDSPWLPHYDGIRDMFYKTGDLGRFNQDGTITVLGRRDFQVKLRGQRLELGEVEYHIMKSDDIEYALTDLLKKKTGDALVAFVSFYGGREPADTEDPLLPLEGATKKILKALVKNLKAKMPEHMVPTIFLPLRKMPMLSGVKISRKALRTLANELSPEQLEAYSLVKEAKVAPTDPMELKLRELWAEVLELEPEEIDRDDDFVKLGADEIAGVYLNTLAKRHGIKLVVEDIFRNPTLSSLAALAKVVENKDTAAEIQPFGLLGNMKLDYAKMKIQTQCNLSNMDVIADAYPCTAVQETLLAWTAVKSQSGISKMVYRLADHVDPENFKRAWKKTLDICKSLRTRVLTIDGRTIQAIIDSDAHWDTNASAVTGQTVIMGYGTSLCRYALVVGDDGKNRFHLAMHHAIYDESSLRLMLETLQNAYMRRPIEETQSYAKFVQYTQGLDREAAAAYWMEQLEDAIPGSFPAKSDIYSTEISILKSVIPCPEALSTTVAKDSLIRAAWALVMSHHCECPDVCFGTTISSQHAGETELGQMSGRTTATVPLRVRIDEDQYIPDFLEDLQDQLSDMVGFERYSLQSIASVSEEAEAACDFSSILAVDLGHKPLGAHEVAPILESTDENQTVEENAMKGYFGYPLVVQASIVENAFEMAFEYDPAVLAEEQVKEVSLRLHFVVQQLLTQEEETPVSEISFEVLDGLVQG